MLTNKGKYGLKALVHLAGTPPGQPVLVSEIAETNEIPRKFLDAILAELRNAGFVASRKGPGGGYSLARPPAQIIVGDVIRVLDGPLAPTPCATPNPAGPCQDCEDAVHCSVRLMMLQAADAISRILDHRTLAVMRAMTERDLHHFTYHI